jgi:hypothetical protein
LTGLTFNLALTKRHATELPIPNNLGISVLGGGYSRNGAIAFTNTIKKKEESGLINLFCMKIATQIVVSITLFVLKLKDLLFVTELN